MLSFTLVSHIGYMIFGIALGTAAGWAATVFYIVHHILVQTTLFLTTGLIERVAGTSNLTKLAGMQTRAPLIAILFFIPMLNLGGIPPFSGFLGKLALFVAGAEGTSLQVPQPLVWAAIGVGAATSLLTLYALIRVWNLGFWRSEREAEENENPLAAPLEVTAGDDVVNESKTNSRLMTGATLSMVVATVALTVFAGPIFDIAAAGGANLLDPQQYIDTVLGTTGVKP